MTLQSSGAISIGQAMVECGRSASYGNSTPTSADYLAQLGRYAAGGQMAWSYWYGKKYLPPINRQVFAQTLIKTDSRLWIFIPFASLQPGQQPDYGVDKWNNNARMYEWTQYMPPIVDIARYSQVFLEVELVGGEWRSGNPIIEQPSAGNQFVARIEFQDWPGDAVYSRDNFLITCIP